MPRIQQRIIVSKATGDAEMTSEVLPDADLDERIRGLKATVPDGMMADPEAVRWAALLCDGCGTTGTSARRAADVVS